MLKLRGGQVHLFGEGRVCQPKTYIVENGRAKLRRFKWGMSVLFFPLSFTFDPFDLNPDARPIYPAVVSSWKLPVRP